MKLLLLLLVPVPVLRAALAHYLQIEVQTTGTNTELSEKRSLVEEASSLFFLETELVREIEIQ